MTSPSGPLYSTRTRIVIVAVVALAAAGFVLAVARTQEGGDGGVATTGESVIDGDDVPSSGPIVEELVPNRGQQTVPNQSTIAIDLAAGWALRSLDVNGVRVADDELDVTSELARYEFRPGDGKSVEQLQPQTNCVTAVIFQQGADAPPRNEIWCFDVS